MKRLLVTSQKQVASVLLLERILAGLTPVAMGLFKVNQISSVILNPNCIYNPMSPSYCSHLLN